MPRDLSDVPAAEVGERRTMSTEATGQPSADDEAALRGLATVSAITGMSPEELLAALRAEAEAASETSSTDDGGYFAEIAFMGRIEYAGYVTQITKHGQPAYHIDLPDKLWGGNPLSWVEHAASAWFSERPMTEASVRRQWESQVRAAAERARREAEWRRQDEQRALTSGSDEDDEEAPGVHLPSHFGGF